MSSNIVPLHSPWQLVADTADQIQVLVCQIPGWHSYSYSGETLSELRRAAAFLLEARALLDQVREREERRQASEL